MNDLKLTNFHSYDALIFDLDGTLIDSMPWHVKAWQQVSLEHGFTLDPQLIYDHGGSSSRTITGYIRDAGCKIDSIDDFVHRKVALYREHLLDVDLFPDVAAILKDTHTRGAKVAIGTGTQRINVEDMLKIQKLTDYVDCIISADDVTKHKPEPMTFLTAAERLHIAPSRCVVFEDGAPGIEAAKRAGMDCVEVLHGRFVAFHKNADTRDL